MPDQYEIDRISLSSVEQQGDRLSIEFSTLTESAFYCPGVLETRTESGIELQFVRCPVGGECSVTYAVDPAAAPPYSVQITNVSGTVRIRDENGLHDLPK